jgi:hypothetical protein
MLQRPWNSKRTLVSIVAVWTMSVVQSYYRDPRFIREFKAKHCVEVFAENLTTKKKYV